MVNSRRKGKRGELEACRALEAATGIDARRTQQFCGKAGTADVEWIDGLHMECKVGARPAIQKAMDQASRDRAEGTLPVVISKQDRGEWLATVRVEELAQFVAVLYLAMAEVR